MGQHWLTDTDLLDRIVEAAEIRADEAVIEVGPGTGLLTERLVGLGDSLAAVELDSRLASRLAGRYAGRPGVAVIKADVLSVSVPDLLKLGGAHPPYVVLGNLPFYVATAIVRHFLGATPPPRRMMVTLQAEVAEAMCASPGAMRLLSVQVQMLARTRLLFSIPAEAFSPSPKVDGAVVSLDVRQELAANVDDLDNFLSFVEGGFSAPRKQLRNSLALGFGIAGPEAEGLLAAARIKPDRRPQTLSLKEWSDLYRVYGQSGCWAG